MTDPTTSPDLDVAAIRKDFPILEQSAGEGGQQMQQSTLARTTGADNSRRLTSTDLQAHITQYTHRVAPLNKVS